MSDYHLLIGGALVPGETTMPVINPATEEVLTDCPRASKDQLDAAVAAAKAAFPAWAATPITERRRLIGKMADIIETHANDLARILTSEQGKPLADATGEVLGMAGFFRYLASLDLPMRVLERSGDRQVEAYRRPLGVVGAIIPWNFPLLILGFKLPPALLAGNTLVVKPAPTTPLSTLRFAELVKDVLPAGVLNVIADANDLGDPMTKHPDIRKISFTGSTATGQKVMASAAQTLKRITLELGGNDAGIVLDDVDPKTVAPGIFDGAFQNSGQVCLAIKRLYVHESVYDEICDELVAIAKSTVVDDGSKQGTKLGPLQNKMQYEKVKAFLDDAHKNGKVIAGGAAMDRPGYFIAPTIVRDIAEGSKLVDEEQFGPVLPVIKYSDSDDVIRRANASSYGLGASVWSSDPKRAHEIATRIEAGTVWINKHLDMAPHIPFGGAKQSGIGSEFAEEGLAE
ncbi:MAG: aldehyde dehydrogenase family protein, partial [Bradyrhizobium sp.]|nr:aldehyde dehydrogenase family protein [Bradyrhizobium sp.]